MVDDKDDHHSDDYAAAADDDDEEEDVPALLGPGGESIPQKAPAGTMQLS